MLRNIDSASFAERFRNVPNVDLKKPEHKYSEELIGAAEQTQLRVEDLLQRHNQDPFSVKKVKEDGSTYFNVNHPPEELEEIDLLFQLHSLRELSQQLCDKQFSSIKALVSLLDGVNFDELLQRSEEKFQFEKVKDIFDQSIENLLKESELLSKELIAAYKEFQGVENLIADLKTLFR